MQYPRRTSEFQEETGTATKRNSRSQSRIARPASVERQTLGLQTSVSRGRGTTPQKQSVSVARASRPGRPTSLDRQTGVLSSALRGGGRSTPLASKATPVQSSKATRVLFSTEKQRNIHDKQWLQEKAQQIVEHLRESAKPGAVHGLPSDFFARSGCLRQLTSKQFAGIINHFLNYIWGTRFTVGGSSYVDDIINILQKLQYPYQVNKSWLMTPNTSHSFGYVIQLFDFLLDFVPPQNEAQEAEMKFECEDPDNICESSLMHESPDAEFTALMLENCEVGFKLWDKQLDDELHKLQQQTCDVLIYKRCGANGGVAALDKQLHKLKEDLVAEQKKRPRIRKEDEEFCQRMKVELKELRKAIHEARDAQEIKNRQLSEMQVERQQCKADFIQLQEKVQQLQNILSKQKMSVDERDSGIEELEQRKYTLQRMEYTLRDLEGRYHHQQILLSRHKKQLTDHISKYNDYIRSLSCTKLPCSTDAADALLLPHNPQHEDVQKRIKMLEAMREQSQIQLQQTNQQLEELDKQLLEQTHYINACLKLKSGELETALKLVERKAKEFEKQKEQQSTALDVQFKNAEERLQQLQIDMKNTKDQRCEKRIQLKDVEHQTEEIMQRSEREYKLAADEREAVLNQYEDTLAQSNQILQEFNELVEQRELELQRIEQVEAES